MWMLNEQFNAEETRIDIPLEKPTPIHFFGSKEHTIFKLVLIRT